MGCGLGLWGKAIICLWMVTCTLGKSAKLSLSLHGAGASFPSEVYRQWMTLYIATRATYIDLTMTYDAKGSSAGKQRIMLGRDDNFVHYAGSDSVMDSTERQEYPNLIMFPTMAGSVVLGYNLPGMGTARLVLTIPVLVGMYNGSIVRWDHPAIVDLNPGLNLPNSTILLLARADKSGTTDIFTSALSTHAAWRASYGSFNTGREEARWEPGTVAYYAYQNRGMVGLIMSFPGSLGYLSVADASIAKLPYAMIRNHHDVVVEANMSSVQEAMDVAAQKGAKNDLTVALTGYGNAYSYPIAGFTYFIVRLRAASNCDSRLELVRYLHWFLTSDAAKEKCIDKYMTPLSNTMVNLINQQVTYRMSCQGETLWPEVSRRIKQEAAVSEQQDIVTEVAVPVSFISAGLITAGIIFLVKCIRHQRQLAKNEWSIDIGDILFYQIGTAQSDSDSGSGNIRQGTYLHMWPSETSFRHVEEVDNGFQLLKCVLQWPAKWNGNTVGLRIHEIMTVGHMKQQTKSMLLNMREFTHNNIVRFWGLVDVEDKRYPVSDYCSKGSLADLIHNPKYTLNNDFKFSIALDVAMGLAYLHSRNVVHGWLSTSCCLLDAKWNVKLDDWEYCHVLRHLEPKSNVLIKLYKNEDEIGQNEAARLNFGTAPEILRSKLALKPLPSMDMYSYAIILYEVFSCHVPYQEFSPTLSLWEVLKAVINNNLRPGIDDNIIPAGVRELLESSWNSDPLKRPSSDKIPKLLHTFHGFKKGILDAIIETTEGYTASLEEQLTDMRSELSSVSSRLKMVMTRTLPPDMLRDSEMGFGSHHERERTLDYHVTVVCVMCAMPARNDNIWVMYNNVDILLENLIPKHKGFRIDLPTGISLVIIGLEKDDNDNRKHTILAANLVLDLLNFNNSVFPSNCTGCGFMIAIDRGVVQRLVQDATSLPKCVLVGDVLETVRVMARRTPPGRIQLSARVAEVLQTAGGRLVVERRKDGKNGVYQ